MESMIWGFIAAMVKTFTAAVFWYLVFWIPLFVVFLIVKRFVEKKK